MSFLVDVTFNALKSTKPSLKKSGFKSHHRRDWLYCKWKWHSLLSSRFIFCDAVGRMNRIVHSDYPSSGFILNRIWIFKVHRTVIFSGNQFHRMSLRFYKDLDHILFMGCKIKGIGFASWLWNLTVLFTQTYNCIEKQLEEIPGSLYHATSISPLCLHWITSSFIQRTSWSTFTALNETSQI